ncbi:MAG TPA: NADH-quinone oxidoreductase subunit J [Candidatus Eisenbacteria bacterium]|nr:NADH-quinone oxidoreductase subunit J [Candidatus Eisenbacteria bacterium]
MLQTSLFYLISAGVLVAAAGVVLSRSAIYGVLCLVAAMCFMAGLFVLLKAFFVATVLVLVYAGAILVLFLFVVMLVDYRNLSGGWQGLGLAPAVALGAAGLLAAETIGVIRTVRLPAAAPLDGTAAAVGEVLFSRYALPFELTSFLLLAAVVSVVVLAKKGAR